jgi:hypothetical protein
MEKISMKEAVSGLPVIHFHAAGIDVGSMLMVASYTNAAGEHCTGLTKKSIFPQNILFTGSVSRVNFAF